MEETKVLHKKKVLAPRLRFKEFDSDWKKTKLDNLFSYRNGGRFEDVVSDDGNVFLISLNSIDIQGKLKLDQKKVDIDINTTDKILEKDELVMVLSDVAHGNFLGLTAIIPEDGKYVLNYRMGALKAKKQLDIFFITQQINRNQRYFKLHGQGSSQLNLTKDDVLSFEPYLPSLPEQEKIAAFLTAVDEKIQQLNRKKQLLTEYKKGVMQQLFSGKLRFKDDKGKAYPKWEEKKLGEVFSEVRDKVGSRDVTTYSITAGFGFISQIEKFGKKISGNQTENYILLKPGQFSFNKGASKTFKFGCVYQNNFDFDIAVPNVFISFELIDKKMSANFYSQLFINHYLDRKLKTIISSTARMDGLLNINKDLFFGLKVPVPFYEEQKKIADFLSAIDKKITGVAEALEATTQFKKGLLQQMFV